jgi:pimeloyl-ACP methyl ester carboxylesterase
MEKVASKDGTIIAFEQSGDGPPLVLVHGTSGTYSRWAPILPDLRKHFTVYAVERRGRGESGDGATPYAIEREFEDVAAVVDSIREPVDLFGHSYGGICALEAALLTDNIVKLVLYEPPILSQDVEPNSDDLASRLQAMLDVGDREGILMTFMRDAVRMPLSEIETSRSMPVWNARVAAAHTLPREVRARAGYRFEAERFKDLTVPTLLLLGGDSPDPLRRAARTLATVLPNSRTGVLPGQRHVAMETAPDLLVKELLIFLLNK